MNEKISRDPETVMLEAVQALNCIKRGDIVELKAYSNPPADVITVL